MQLTKNVTVYVHIKQSVNTMKNLRKYDVQVYIKVQINF